MIAVLPGSRASEVEALAGRFLQAAALLQARRPAAWFVVPALPALQARIGELARRHGPARQLKIVTGQSHAVLAACDVALVASGTATLEAALFKRPMVISYHTHWLTYALMKPRHLQPWIGLPNILCQDFVVPELLQDNAKPELLWRGARATGSDAPARMHAVQAQFRDLHLRLHATPPPCHRCHRKSPPGLSRSAWTGSPPGLMAGVDEAGRGPLAGPVVAAAVILDDSRRILGLADSKVLTPATRERLFDKIRDKALCCAVGSASVDEIDSLNIFHATMLAMKRAVEGLRLKPAKVLVDGNRLPPLDVLAEAIVDGDAKVQAISAASIIAKVTRDRCCVAAARAIPAVRLCRPQGLRHGGAPGGAARARALRRTTDATSRPVAICYAERRRCAAGGLRRRTGRRRVGAGPGAGAVRRPP